MTQNSNPYENAVTERIDGVLKQDSYYIFGPFCYVGNSERGH
ncbi:hypothetical protein [Myroides guanonis]|uniref:Uncharacterized protein n=1 Tax=Myroides guanonis TaxID=1150112 RepID=A0A1I3MDR8_9FLAO|nr:hypothetical protein [Myroides guanonis]SFI95264.1 hypothetical protein SAMN04487893_102129 [Myroides guanonis]